VVFSLFSLFNTLGQLDFSWSTLRECGILGVLEKEGKEEKETAKGYQDQHLQYVLIESTELHVCFPQFFWHA